MIRESTVITRKKHYCHACEKPIEKGEKCNYSTGVDRENGGWWTIYMHPECWNIYERMRVFWRDFFDDGVEPGFLNEHHKDENIDYLTRLEAGKK